MHEKARDRLTELAVDALKTLEIKAPTLINITGISKTLGPLSAFISQTFSEWILEDWATVSVYLSLRDAVKEHGPFQTGLLGVTATQAVLEAIAASVANFWSAVPISYEFVFPLPGLSPFATSIEIAPGVTLSNALRAQVDTEGLQSSFSGVIGVPQLFTSPAEIPAVTILSKGLMQAGDPTELAAVGALRRAKIILQLGIVEEVFTRSSEQSGLPKFATFAPQQALPVQSQRFNLPPGIASVLARLRYRPVSALADPPPLGERLSAVGLVLAREEARNASKAARRTVAASQAQYDQHCARVATAAEWLFDSETEPESATSFVQAAIAFEALYGGNKREPVVETLANRVAYSLGTTPQDREQLTDSFLAFYGTRSKVVHSGATRLTSEQQRQLRRAQFTLKEALRHELGLVRAGAG
jgi:hypothetical protein